MYICLYAVLSVWLGGVTVGHLTYDQEVMGSSPGWVTIRWSLLGRVTVCRQVNHVVYDHPFRVGK